MKKLMLMLVFMLLAVAAYATTLKCNIDGSGMYFTGKVETEWGKLLYEHVCFVGQHRFWLTAEQMNN
jgi:hypothetical protein